ncbi:Alpha/Beta hydrolase protein [Xylogone sp. PMI_703]|nr:Alpha/Beta hydrolase protein [Xylogone sp. PMI_703]
MSLPSYSKQPAWRMLQDLLPTTVHLSSTHEPTEEWWSNHGHNIHLDRWRNPEAKIRVILHHGVGTNGRQLSMILGVPLQQAGFEIVAIDMPNYGLTQVKPHSNVAYSEWVDIADDFINFELENDPRPVVLYGLSAGGMLAYHTAAQNKKVSGVIGMTFLDQRIQQVRDETCLNLFMSRVGVPTAGLFGSIPLLNRFSIPMSLASKMWALVNDKAALKIMMKDKTSAGNLTSMKFLSTYMNHKPALEPEKFDVCPILLTQPDLDKWTPLHLSELVLRKIKLVEVKTVILENAGHYPIEEPGVVQMADAIIAFLHKIEKDKSL